MRLGLWMRCTEECCLQEDTLYNGTQLTLDFIKFTQVFRSNYLLLRLGTAMSLFSDWFIRVLDCSVKYFWIYEYSLACFEV